MNEMEELEWNPTSYSTTRTKIINNWADARQENGRSFILLHPCIAIAAEKISKKKLQGNQ
jgi:hypothetical protein